MDRARYTLTNLGDVRVLTVDGREHRTYYSERVIRLLIERKGLHRTPPYFTYKETRGRYFLGPLFAYFETVGLRGLRVLEVGCSFGHLTEYLNDQPAVSEISTFDVDHAFVQITRAKVEDLGLAKVRDVRHLTSQATRHLPYPDQAFDLVVAAGVVEHLPIKGRHRYVDEYYRVFKGGGYIGFFDSPNRYFPLETHSVGLPFVQWLPPELAFVYAKLSRPRKFQGVSLSEFTRPGTGWRNATYAECLPTTGMIELEDLTEATGYGYQFFRSTARTWKRKALLPVFSVLAALAKRLGVPPSLVLPYLNLVFLKRRDYEAVTPA
jgi:SAM-dependent methyltransferase